MGLRPSVGIAMAIACMIASAQDTSDEELARLLADSNTRQSAVAKIVASGGSKVLLLLSWTRKPPVQVDESELYIGLADVFGKLKTKEAIPFLMKNISIQRWPPSPNTWMKTPQVIEARLPAAAALIQIGPEASKALIHTWEQLVGDERLAAIFVVSRIRGVPEARDFLVSVSGAANMERFWAEEGIKLLDKSRSPSR